MTNKVIAADVLLLVGMILAVPVAAAAVARRMRQRQIRSEGVNGITPYARVPDRQLVGRGDFYEGVKSAKEVGLQKVG